MLSYDSTRHPNTDHAYESQQPNNERLRGDKSPATYIPRLLVCKQTQQADVAFFVHGHDALAACAAASTSSIQHNQTFVTRRFHH